MAEETGLGHSLSETLKTGFVTPRLILYSTFQLMVYDYCKFRKFRENFIFVISVKHIIATIEIVTRARFIYISNDRVISPFGVDFISTKLHICEGSRK